MKIQNDLNVCARRASEHLKQLEYIYQEQKCLFGLTVCQLRSFLFGFWDKVCKLDDIDIVMVLK